MCTKVTTSIHQSSLAVKKYAWLDAIECGQTHSDATSCGCQLVFGAMPPCLSPLLCSQEAGGRAAEDPGRALVRRGHLPGPAARPHPGRLPGACHPARAPWVAEGKGWHAFVQDIPPPPPIEPLWPEEQEKNTSLKDGTLQAPPSSLLQLPSSFFWFLGMELHLWRDNGLISLRSTTCAFCPNSTQGLRLWTVCKCLHSSVHFIVNLSSFAFGCHFWTIPVPTPIKQLI